MTEAYWRSRAIKAEGQRMALWNALHRLEAVIENDTLADGEVEEELTAALKQAREALEMPSGEPVVTMTNKGATP